MTNFNAKPIHSVSLLLETKHLLSYVEPILENTVNKNDFILTLRVINFFVVYVDASDMCNDLGFTLADTGSTVTRSWTIKVSTISKVVDDT